MYCIIKHYIISTMSEYTFWTERYKNNIVGKYEVGQNQENVYPHIQNVKVADNKNDAGRRKGLSENCATRTTVSKSVIGKAPFDVYQDDNDENLRSRSRVRKDTCKRELKVKREHGTVERISANAAKLVTKKRSVSPLLRVVSRRARSSSNTRNQTVGRRSNELLGCKYFQRSNSESRRTVSQHVQPDASKATSPRVKNLLSNEVKKRTSSSIQMWKDKMRNQHTGTLPKSNFENAHSNVSNRMHTKIKSRKNSILDRNVLHHRSNSANPIHLNNFTDKVRQNQPINPDKNVKEQIEKRKDTPGETETSINSRLKTIIKSSNEIAAYLGRDLLNAEANVVARSFDSEDNQDNQLQDASKNSTFMIPDVSAMLLSSVKKMRYEKREEQRNFKKRDEENDVYQVPHECYYLEDMLDMERKKEEHAPKLSSRFLHENVNAEQRRLIVGYLIHVSVHCNYSSHIIYQTIKLFDVIIDRIFVETDNIQLIALACLWINLKRDATFKDIPSATTILQLAKDMYVGQEKQLLIYEKKILLTVNFNICFTDSFSLLFYYIWCVNEDEIINPHDTMLIYFCGSYLLDVTMLDEHLCDISGCMLAMAATELSLSLIYLDDINIVTRIWYESWRNKYRLTEWEERAISRAKQNMVRQVLESKNRGFSLNVVYKKYLRSKHGRISNFLINRMQKLAQGRYSEEFF